MDDLATNSVGQSHQSYQFSGSQWALAIDAACPVSAYREDLLEKAGCAVPQNFDDLIKLAQKGLVGCPSIPLDVYGNLLNLLKSDGESIFPNNEEIADREAALCALGRLKQLADLTPDKFFELNPIRSLELMSQTDDIAYLPYTYGYTNYSREGYAPNLVTFGDVIGISANQPGSSMLGGTGIALSSKSKNLELAAKYASYVASPNIQTGIFYQAGGQPAHRSAWTNDSLNLNCSSFFSNTLTTHDRAFVRPRYAGYLNFQDHAGLPIHDYLKNGGDAGTLLDSLNKMYRQSLAHI
jgi:multiple sugar transport system substrate-binding protein